MKCNQHLYRFYTLASTFLLLLCSSYSVFAQDDVEDKFDTLQTMQKNGYNKIYYKNGIVSSEGALRKGKPDGYWKNYYPDGKLKSEGNRRGYLLDSVWKFYSEKGFINSQIPYKNGLKNGILKSYYDSAKLKSEEDFKEGKKQGLTVFYHLNGGVTNEIPFEMGLENGVAKEYDSKGIVNEVTYYKDAYIIKQLDVNRTDGRGWKQGVWMAFYDSSQQVRWEGFYKNDKKHGTFKEYSRAGNLLKVEEYVNGELLEFSTASNGRKVKVEVRRQYYENSQERIVGTYKDGVPDGVFREFDMSGNIIAATVYTEGRPMRRGLLDEFGLEQGFWQNLFEEGNIRSEGQYLNGKKIGPWRFYHNNGKLMQDGVFKDDKPVGAWKWYYESGYTQREEFYNKNGLEDGEMKEYADSSKQIVTTLGFYNNGKRNGEWTYNIGESKVVGSYGDDQEEGVWKEYYPDGVLSFEGKYHDGLENGDYKIFYPNGTPREERFYRNGNRDKIWKFFEPTGLLIATVEFKDDKAFKINGKKIDFEKGKKPVKMQKRIRLGEENPLSKE